MQLKLKLLWLCVDYDLAFKHAIVYVISCAIDYDIGYTMKLQTND